MNIIQLFVPSPDTLYTLDATARLAEASRHAILVYVKHGLAAPYIDEAGAYYFDDNAIRVLRRIQRLHASYGLDLPAIKMVLELMNEIERLQAEVRILRR
ncbi:MAG: MerR family transcriptional regulator [Trueperaceae bacterium]|nr:MerR family transcriptional regulator [Trueperaceae bacterium]